MTSCHRSTWQRINQSHLGAWVTTASCSKDLALAAAVVGPNSQVSSLWWGDGWEEKRLSANYELVPGSEHLDNFFG